MDIIRQHRGLFIFESIVFMILGLLALFIPGFFTLSFEILVGLLFLVGGAVQLFRTFQSKTSTNRCLTLLSAILYIAAGIVMLLYPAVGILSMTLVIAILFFLQGLFQIWFGFSARSLPRWFWWVISGLISIALAAIVWSGWPESAIWFIGILVGVNLFITGLAQFFVALDA